MTRFTAASLPIALALVLMSTSCSQNTGVSSGSPSSTEASGDGDALPELEKAPPVQIVDLPALQAALEAHRGKAVLLNFWATWCAPCVEELPELFEVHQEFRERGGEVVLVSYDLMIPSQGPDAMRDKVQAFVDAKGYSMEQLLFDDDDYDAINAALNLPGPVPVTLAFDGEGREVDRHVEKAGKARFVEMMEKAIAATNP